MILQTTLNQMTFLFLLIIIGFILAKLNVVPGNTESALSKLENFLFIPALVMGTFMKYFSPEKLIQAKELLIGSFVIEIIVIVVSFFFAKLLSKENYLRNILLYGLCFSNFAFMGNAIVSALFPEIFLEYLLFTMVLWMGIYVWGAPALLMGGSGEKIPPKQIIKNILNPMFIGMIIGMVTGLTEIKMPAFLDNLVTSLGNCMSPIAMLLTGMTIARRPILETIKDKSIYFTTILRLIIYPLAFIVIAKFVPMSETLKICALCSIAMPMGLNTIVIPSAYGKDTKVASGMAVVSHILACITIPIIFYIFELI